MHQDIENRFKREADAYQKIHDLVMPKVVRWEYFLEPAWSWSPGPQVIKKPAAKSKADYAYGYDDVGRVVVIQAELQILKILGWKRPAEEFLRYTKNMIEVSEFRNGSLNSVTSVTLLDGRVIREAFASSSDSFIDEFEWQGECPSKMLRRCRSQKSAIEFSYDATEGWKAEFRVKPDGTRRPIDQPLPKGVTVKSLAEKIRKCLVKSVYELVSKSGITEPIYCVVLAYSGEGNDVFPPSIGIGLESERQMLLKKLGGEAKHAIWNPEEFSHQGKEIDDDDYEEACDWFSEAMNERSSDAAALKLINEIAVDLAKLKWSRIAKVTDDFVVFAVDLEGADLRKNMKKSVSPQVLQRLKAAGML